MVRFINDHRDQYGIDPICAVAPMAPSTHFRQQALAWIPAAGRLAQRDDAVRIAIQRIWDANFQVYEPRKVCGNSAVKGVQVARRSVGRLMREMGLAGAVRGRAWITTTHAQSADRPADRVERQFKATRPNQLRVSDFTYVARKRSASRSGRALL